jgi:hypothetical protein
MSGGPEFWGFGPVCRGFARCTTADGHDSRRSVFAVQEARRARPVRVVPCRVSRSVSSIFLNEQQCAAL